MLEFPDKPQTLHMWTEQISYNDLSRLGFEPRRWEVLWSLSVLFWPLSYWSLSWKRKTFLFMQSTWFWAHSCVTLFVWRLMCLLLAHNNLISTELLKHDQIRYSSHLISSLCYLKSVYILAKIEPIVRGTLDLKDQPHFITRAAHTSSDEVLLIFDTSVVILTLWKY